MTVIDQIVENQISLLKVCMLFYADEKNHIKSNDGKSPIDLDGGTIARQTLKTVQQLSDENKKLSDDYDTLVKQMSTEEILVEITRLTNPTIK